MSAMTAAHNRTNWSGGKGRRLRETTAHEADGALEFHPVGIDVSLGGGAADQRADRVMGEQIAIELLADHVRALRTQHPPRPPQIALELPVPCLILPPLMVGLGHQFGGR